MRDARGSIQALAAGESALVTLSAAIAAGDSSAIARESERALVSGVSPNALYEAILQSYLFVGFPRAIEAFFAARPALDRVGGKPRAVPADEPERWRKDGEALCLRVYGRNYEKLLATMRSLSPDLADRMIVEGYGKTLSRPALGPAEREYAVIAILTVTRMWRQLRSHAIGAIHVGGTRAGVQETIGLCREWAGGVAVDEALRIVGMEDAG
jgi:4-carboxymuconolactone decarboxylase